MFRNGRVFGGFGLLCNSRDTIRSFKYTLRVSAEVHSILVLTLRGVVAFEDQSFFIQGFINYDLRTQSA